MDIAGSKRNTSARGMTMIETMTAMVIISASFLSLLGAMSSSSTLTSTSAEDVEAILLCENKVAEMKQYSQNNFTNVWLAYTSPGATATGTAPTGTPLTRNDLLQSASPSNTNPSNFSFSTYGYCWGTTWNQTSQSIPAPLGWNPPPWATNSDIQSLELRTRLGGSAFMAVHFMPESEYALIAGLAPTGALPVTLDANHQIDLPLAPATRNYYGGSATAAETVVSTTYQYYPVKVSVTWTPVSSKGQSNPNAATKTVFTIGIITQPVPRSQ